MGRSSEKLEWLGVVVLVLFFVGLLALGAAYFGSKIVERLTPSTPTPEPGSAVVREVPRPEDAGECSDEWASVQEAVYPPYMLSALSSMETMGLLPEATEVDDLSFAWSWEAERGLEYRAKVENHGEFLFTIDCFVETLNGTWIVFRTVEIRQLND